MPTAAEQILSKAPMPTPLSSAEIRASVAESVRARSLFSACTTEAGYLARLQELLRQAADGEIDKATFVKRAQDHLLSMGYDPEAEGAETGSIRDRASERRLKLIYDTNVQRARAVAKASAQTPETLRDFPAWRLVRVSGRRTPRLDWIARWQAAGDESGWRGAHRSDFVALKDSPIWSALGHGAGGFKDCLDCDTPPFCFGSGVGWADVSREECQQLELPVESLPPTVTLAPDNQEYVDAFNRLPPELRAAAEEHLRRTA